MLGDAQVIGSIPVAEISSYHQARYTGPNVVVAAAGHLEHEQIVELARRRLSAPAGEQNGVPGEGADDAVPRFAFQAKETEQYHICFGGPGISRSDERRFALGVLDAIFGGSTSSRLFREVREKRGLAYAVGSYSEQYVDHGMVAMYVGTREDNVREACEIIGRELASLRDHGVSAEELERAKEHVKGRTVLGLEATSARMSRLARATLFGIPLLSLDEILERIEQVSAEDVAELATRALRPRAALGRVHRPQGGALQGSHRVGQSRSSHQRDPGGRLGRRGAHGRDGVRGCRRGRRSRARRAGRTRRCRLRLADVLDGADVVVDFTTPEAAARERSRVPGRRRPCRGRHHRVRARVGTRPTQRRRPATGSAPACSWRPTSRSERC